MAILVEDNVDLTRLGELLDRTVDFRKIFCRSVPGLFILVYFMNFRPDCPEHLPEDLMEELVLTLVLQHYELLLPRLHAILVVVHHQVVLKVLDLVIRLLLAPHH